MGSILDFRPRETARKPVGDRPSAPATVLMFTGVRYERAPQAEPAQKWTAAGWLAPFQPNPIPQS